MVRKRSERKGQEFWTKVVGEFERSSLSQREFCAARRLGLGTFRYWLYRLRRRTEASTGPRFVPLVASNSPLPGSCRIRVGQAELSFSTLPEPKYLAELLQLMDR